jgi:transposase IS116/IS110/IS902 family protein
MEACPETKPHSRHLVASPEPNISGFQAPILVSFQQGPVFEKLGREKYGHTALLRQVKGVGPITALAYVLTLENPERFAKSRDVGRIWG